MTSGKDRVRALCCKCGNLRTVSARYSPRDRTADDGRDPQGWRMTGTLMCSECKTTTTHALLRDDKPQYRDSAEESQWASRADLQDRLFTLTEAVRPGDLDTPELRALVGLLTSAWARLVGRDS
jgi:hypothetical protein